MDAPAPIVSPGPAPDIGEPPAGFAGRDRERAPLAAALDDFVLALIANQTGGLSHFAVATAFFDWANHLTAAPGRRFELAQSAFEIGWRAWRSALGADRPGAPAAANAMTRAFDELDVWVEEAALGVPGVSRKHGEMVRFVGHQMLEAWRPENFFVFNTEAMRRAQNEAGLSLVRGGFNLFADAMRQASPAAQRPGGAFVVGETLATAEGAVVYRNELIEVIQYTPTTPHVRPEPVLITPAWIMKYYILDLSPHNSLVRYLVDNGFTVFIISWRNPGQKDGGLSFDDYRRRGVLSALDVVSAARPNRKIHTVGYCLGGTLLSIAAAALARDGDERLASVTLLAAQTDFRDPGPLGLFIDEDQLEMLDASMGARGYLTAEQMSGAFKLLRSRELIWRRMQRAYLLGEEEKEIDLMAWNADATRMPYRMHSEYLRRLFLNNDFVQGRFEVDGRPVAVSHIRAPICALGTIKDHVAPWRSVFKIHLFADTDVTFLLTNGGHNAGVVNEPGHPHRHHFVLTKPDTASYIAPDEWLRRAQRIEGSWWPTWLAWLEGLSGAPETPPAVSRSTVRGNRLDKTGAPPPAPGRYVFE